MSGCLTSRVVLAWLVMLAWAEVSEAAAPPVTVKQIQAALQRAAGLEDQAYGHALAGRFGEALRLDSQALDLRRCWLPQRHYLVQGSLDDVKRWQRLARLPLEQQKLIGQSIRHERTATANRQGGRYQEAEKEDRRALEIRLKVLGEYHHDTAASYNNLAFCLDKQGKHAEALPLYRKALEVSRKVLGEEHPDTAASHNNVAFCLNGQGKHAEALPLYRKALEINLKVLGEDHPDTATYYNNVASCLDDQGKHAEALPVYRKALEIRRKVLGEDHPDTADNYSGMASCLHAQGKYAEALHLWRKAFEIRRKVLGEEHPVTAASSGNVAICLIHQGKHAEALPLCRKALEINLKIFGQDYPETASSYNNLASCFNGPRKHAEALPLYRKALEIRRAVLGEQHPSTATSYNNVASCLDDQGKHAEALPLFRKALEIWHKVLGEDHPDTATSYNNVASCLDDQGKHAEALPLFRKALEIRRTVLGEDHPDTATSYNNLALRLWQQGQVSEALRLLQGSLPGQETARFHKAKSGFDRVLAAGNLLSPQRLLAMGLSRLNQPRNAFRHAEISFGRSLVDDLPADGTDRQHLAELSAVAQKLDDRMLPLLSLSSLSPDQKRLLDELSRQRRETQSELSRLISGITARQILSLSQIQEQLPSDAALVFWLDDYRLGEHQACIVRQEGEPIWLSLPGTGRTEAWTRADLTLPGRLDQALKEPGVSLAERNRLIEALRKQRLEPLQPHLKGVNRLFVVPQGDMARVPVELLCPEYEVCYVSSGSMLAKQRKQHRPLSGNSLLALGNPNFTPPSVKAPEPPAQGLLLSAVLPGSTAARAGLLAGDVLLAWGSHKLNSLRDLNKAQAEGPGRARYWREGKQMQTREVPPGKLGVTIDPSPAPLAVKRWRELSTALVKRGTGHRPLPGTAHEVRTLVSLLGKKPTRLLLGSEASEQALDELLAREELKKYRMLHFATHGEVDEVTPDNCRLILAQDRLPDPLKLTPGQKDYTGELTVKTIREHWKLDADLVVLSACETALGKDSGGEGLLGFAQAFLSRGARSVVLSRWKVDDSATALLMVRFYENLLGSRSGTKALGRAKALQEAKDWLRQLPRDEAERRVAALTAGQLRGSDVPVPRIVEGSKPKLPEGDLPFAHPFFWAAFVLIGDPD